MHEKHSHLHLNIFVLQLNHTSNHNKILEDAPVLQTSKRLGDHLSSRHKETEVFICYFSLSPVPEEKSDQKGTMKSNEKCATILPLDPLIALATCQGAFFLLLATWENVDTVVRVTRVKAGPKRKKKCR